MATRHGISREEVLDLSAKAADLVLGMSESGELELLSNQELPTATS